MSEKDTVYVLRCGDCNKPFNKKSTLKRHGYYCRSRRTSSTLKPRSCVSCARRKIRCDKTQPQCSRCKAKGVECHYVTRPAKPTRGNPQTNHKLSNAKTSNASPTLLTRMSFQSHPGTNNDDDTTRDSSLVTSGNQFVGFEWDALNWDNSHIDFSNFLNAEFNESMQEPSYLWGLTDYPTTTSMIDQVQSINFSIPPQPTSNPRSLNQRPRTRPGTQRTITLIQHTLKSYLLTMLRHNSLPPFVHSGLASTTSEMEPLSNCISLVHMISSGTRGSRKLFWRNVRMECERLCSECGRFTNWDLLASMQAVSIYILFRLDEGETEQNDFDSLLLATVTILAQQLIRKDIASNYSLERSWKDWLYEESRRRLGVIYRIVNMLVYFDAAKMCNLPSDLVLAPLPAKKELWEAGDEQAWNLECEKDPGAIFDFGLAKSGGLVRLGDGVQDAVLVHTAITSESPARTSVGWEEWCSGMDGFGGLVMLAASLVVE